jgi:hypothetical protein
MKQKQQMPANGLENVKNVNLCFLFYLFFKILLPTLPHLFVCFTSTNTLSHLVYTVSENIKRWGAWSQFFCTCTGTCSTHPASPNTSTTRSGKKTTLNSPPKMQERKPSCRRLLTATIIAIMRQKIKLCLSRGIYFEKKNSENVYFSFTSGKVLLCRWLQLAQLAKGKKSRP